ncbi:MAG: sodium:calcium antiporter [Cyanobacteria bacterium P01_D01_bin.50]
MDVSQLPLYIGAIVISTAFVWVGSFFLESAAEGLSEHYQLPPVVQGGVVLAVGSSFPELSTTVLSTLIHGKFELGVAAIFGSAIFNILVIPGISGLVGKELKFKENKDFIYRDVQFQITSIAVLLITFAGVVLYNPVPNMMWQGNINRWIALIPLSVYGLYLFLQQQSTELHKAQPKKEQEENQDTEGKEISIVQEWLKLIFSLAIIVASVEGLVWGTIGLGEVLNTPSFLWGITIIAAATSLPDAFVSIRAAQNNDSIISLSNVLGSNIFDLLVAIPVGILIAGASVVDFAITVPMMGASILATIALFLMLLRKFDLSRSESVLLLVMYGAFVAWMVSETFGITNVI